MLLFASCRQESVNDLSYNDTTPFRGKYIPDNSVIHEEKTKQIDSNYKYEYRSGTTGNYKYHYDVTGRDAEGNEVSGEVDVSGKYGNGTLLDSEGNEADVTVEWIRNGELMAEDEQGNVWELEVE